MMQRAMHVRRANSGSDLSGLLHEVAVQMLTPDVVTCGAAISACGKGNHGMLTPDVVS